MRALGCGHGHRPCGQLTVHPPGRGHLCGTGVHERHGLGVLVAGLWHPAGELVDAVAVSHEPVVGAPRLSSLGVTPASCACAAVTMPYPSAAMSYMPSKCIMSKPWHISIGFDNTRFDSAGSVGVSSRSDWL